MTVETNMNKELFIKQLNTLIEEHKSLRAQSKYKDLSDLPKTDRQSLVTRSVAAIHRISGISSPYAAEINRILETIPALHEHTSPIIGVVQALRDDIEAGYIQNLAELIHGEIFADFLEMAEYLSDNGYKDASAVITGSTLESHLRKQCIKNSIPIEETAPDGKIRPLKADFLNSELAKANVYSKLDQKNVTAWLDLRNKAAHGQYDQYTTEQVTLLVSGVREFISRNPA
jgi:hypothetical protein